MRWREKPDAVRDGGGKNEGTRTVCAHKEARYFMVFPYYEDTWCISNATDFETAARIGRAMSSFGVQCAARDKSFPTLDGGVRHEPIFPCNDSQPDVQKISGEDTGSNDVRASFARYLHISGDRRY